MKRLVRLQVGQGEGVPVGNSSGRRLVVLAALLTVLVSVAPGHASCDPSTNPDKTDIVNARAAVAANCDCTGATSHSAYLTCAVQQANAVLVNKSCLHFVRKCASRSPCGRPGFVICYRTTASGGKRCSMMRDAGVCMAYGGTVPGPGNSTSCCDDPATCTGPDQPCGNCGHGECLLKCDGSLVCVDGQTGMASECGADVDCPVENPVCLCGIFAPNACAKPCP